MLVLEGAELQEKTIKQIQQLAAANSEITVTTRDDKQPSIRTPAFSLEMVKNVRTVLPDRKLHELYMYTVYIYAHTCMKNFVESQFYSICIT